MKAKCPIVPIAFVDSFRVLDQKGSGRMTVQIHYLPAIAYEEFAGMSATEVAALVKGRIQEKIDQCLAQCQGGKTGHLRMSGFFYNFTLANMGGYGKIKEKRGLCPGAGPQQEEYL